MKKMNNKGFSLVELIVVVLIMAIIAVALAPQVMKWVENSRKSNDIENYNAIGVAIRKHLLQNREVLPILHVDKKNAEKYSKIFIDLIQDEIYISMLHELDHALVLERTTKINNKSIMNPYNFTSNDISELDLKQLFDLYGWSYC